MTNKRVFIIETETYKSSLIKLKDSEVIRMVEKKVKKLIGNPEIACPMSKQHEGICEIRITGKYRVYCIKKEKTIILFLLCPAINHKKNYGLSKEYKKLFNQMKKVEKEYGESILDEFEKSLN